MKSKAPKDTEKEKKPDASLIPKNKFKDLTGLRFNKLKVIRRIPNKGTAPQWLCKCDCGKIIKVLGYNLRSRNTQSCGCFKKSQIQKTKTKHGLSSSYEYQRWLSLKNRCKDPSCIYHHGRNIQMCKEWENSFEQFYHDMGPCPNSKKYSIDRINNDGNYEPSNCRWATTKEQANNRRTNRKITYKNKTKGLKEWANYLGITHSSLQERLKYWTLSQALETPKKENKNDY